VDTDRKLPDLAGHRPRANYAEWSNTDLVVRLILLRHRGRLCALRILALEGSQDWKALFRRASRIIDDPNPKVLAALHRVWPHAEPLLYLLWVRSECEHAAEELHNRLSSLPVGSALLAMLGVEPPPEAVSKLKQALHVSEIGVHKDFRHEEDAGDVQQVAVTHAMGQYRWLTEGVEVKQEVTDAQLRELCMPPDFGIPDAGETFPETVTFVAAQCRAALVRVGPIFDGHVETAPAHAHQALRDHFEKRRAQKRTGRRVPIERVTGRHAAGPNPDVRADVEAAYEFAVKRWGAKGKRFVTALLEAETTTEAAKAAGVSRPTAGKYVKELRRHLS
jgi:hypothetical protein